MPESNTFSERLKTIAEGVLTLEVNTIISLHIEAEKMPAPEHALIQIANEYRMWLKTRHQQSDIFGSDSAPSEASVSVFLDLRTRAKDCLQAGQDSNLLERIRSNSDQLMGICLRIDREAGSTITLQRTAVIMPKTIELKPEEIVIVRKAWELMLDEITLQTTIQIDGDVVMRVLRRNPDGIDMAQVMKAHERAVNVSTRFWAELVSLIGGALSELGQFLTGGRAS